MTICRIDDADRLDVSYQKKMSSGTALTLVLSVLILFAGLFAYGSISISDSDINAGFILILIPVLIVLLLGDIKYRSGSHQRCGTILRPYYGA